MKHEYQAAMERVKMPPECEARILAALERKPSRRGWRPGTVLLAAVLVVVMATSAVALSPALQEYIEGAAGKFSPFVSPIEGTVVTEDGYELRVTSAVADHYLSYVKLEVREMNEARLTEDMRISVLFRRVNPDSKSTGAAILGGDVLYCAPDGKTAMLAIMQWGDLDGADSGVILDMSSPMECEIPVTLEYVPIQTIDLSGVENGDRLIPLDRLEISPLGISMYTKYWEEATDKNTKSVNKLRGELTVHYADGSQRTSIQDNVLGTFKRLAASWLFMDPYNRVQPKDVEPLDTENIVGISCKNWYLPLDNGIAGTIQWND